jgi:multicomponent Na+:H+ antiporter subunit D
VALLTPTGIEGGLVHIANHAFSKITLFFCAGAIYVAAHKKNISEMSGLGRSMPWTFGAFAMASLSMIGAPPVAGFVTKLVPADRSARCGIDRHPCVLLISTLLNAAYFVPVVYQGSLAGRPPEDAHAHAHGTRHRWRWSFRSASPRRSPCFGCLSRFLHAVRQAVVK